MSRSIAFLMRHQVIVETYLGNTSTGPRYAAAEPLPCFLDAQIRMVRSPAGEQVTSSSTVYAEPGTVVPPASRVTLPDGQVATVIWCKDRDGGGLSTPDHVEIALE